MHANSPRLIPPSIPSLHSCIALQGRSLAATRSPSGRSSSPRPANNVHYRYIPVHIAPNPSQPVYQEEQQAAAPPVSVCPA